jgi:hypothetical protein
MCRTTAFAGAKNVIELTDSIELLRKFLVAGQLIFAKSDGSPAI